MLCTIMYMTKVTFVNINKFLSKVDNRNLVKFTFEHTELFLNYSIVAGSLITRFTRAFFTHSEQLIMAEIIYM